MIPIKISGGLSSCLFSLSLVASFFLVHFNLNQTGGASDAPFSNLNILSLLKEVCSNLVTFPFKPFNNSWKSHFWNLFCQFWKICCWSQLVSKILNQRIKRTFYQNIVKQTLLFLPKFEFYMKNAFFRCIYCWYSSKIEKLEIFRNFLVKLYYNGNFAIFFCFLQKKILKMALMNWKWSQLSGKCVFGALWRSRAKLDRGGIRCPPQSWQALSDVSLIRVNWSASIEVCKFMCGNWSV